MSIDRLKREHNVVTSWLHFPLHPETPSAGIALKDLFKNRPKEEISAAGEHLRKLMAEAGLPYGRRTMTYNSRLAQELGCWADDQHPGSDIHDALFKAYFVDNRDISQQKVLIEIAVSVGLDATQVKDVLENRLYSPQITAHWERAWDSGVTGVPTFSSRDLYVVGCQPYDVLERFLNHLIKLRGEDSTMT